MEECPSPLVGAYPELRSAMGEAAIRVARAAGYSNAGTAEFLVDADRNFYFLEMNTRLQVEHPVTELVTGLDLVQLQLRVASGEKLPFSQEDVEWRGWALECRVYAEDPDHQFFPSPGRIALLREPAGPGIRLDSGVYPGWTVPIDYDPLLAKLIAYSPNRETTIRRMLVALDEYVITGIETNIGFFKEILNDPEFRAAHLDTGFLEKFMHRRKNKPAPETELEIVAAIAAEAYAAARQTNGIAQAPGVAPASRWAAQGRERLR
jgi:acetyl-CoA carboxylase biotin carboxylase subunit